MSLETFAEVDHLALQLALAVICIIGASYAWMVVQFLRHRRDGLAAERRLLNEPLPSDSELPHVLVQVPTFNEGDLICRIAGAIMELDWPTNRLHVQILDDSNDGGVAFAAKAIAMLRERNIDAALLHRKSRDGFKGGALAAGLQSADQEFVAVLDVDYVPPKEFLKSCMRPLLRDPSLAFVQARADFLNANETLMTRIQQRILDVHFSVEQASRNWSGNIMAFNGTCGIWRRAAIVEAGGWQGDTLTEDVDLSYRAQLLGWRALFMMSVAVPGELPTTLKAWVSQQLRWTKGFAEVNRKLLSAVLFSRLTWQQKIISILHLGASAFGPVLALALISGTLDVGFVTGLTFATSLLLTIITLELVVVQFMILFAQREIRRANLLAEVFLLPLVVCAYGGVQLLSLRANIDAWRGFKTAFVRTPKQAAQSVALSDVTASPQWAE